jgi:hypothetical protein
VGTMASYMGITLEVGIFVIGRRRFVRECVSIPLADSDGDHGFVI